MTTRSGRVTKAALGALAATAILFGAAGVRTPAFAQARTMFDFEDGAQGFIALSLKGGQPADDPDVKLEQVKDKDLVKTGEGALSYSYKLDAGTIRLLALPAKIAPDTKSIRFWARSNTPTSVALFLREPDNSRYGVNVMLPANEWTLVSVNVDELTLSPGAQDENGKLDLDQVDTVALVDFAWTFLGNAALAKAIPNAAGQRQLVIDDFQLSTEAGPVSTGRYTAGENEYLIVDNFESGTIRWMPVRANFNEKPPVIEFYPADAPVKILPEASAPGAAKSPIEPGGKGLRFSYKRTAGQAYALIYNLADRDLKGVKTLKLNLRVTHKALVIIEVKEKDGSKYQQNLYPDDNKNWRSLSYPLGTLVQADDSTDENDKIDVDQIQEISISDSSPMMAESTPPGDVTIEVDGVYFQIK